ncbi:hypothetical protein [Micromonospora sp. CPCC 205739]|uniref:hypothetical protein n=1 Tax=Micromonospora sp. CPCC 205739 TaxID=3122404 RepID=UPI002FEE7B60
MYGRQPGKGKIEHRPGAGIYQMNGQPTAQNTRETGADGDLPGLRNWDNVGTSKNWPH